MKRVILLILGMAVGVAAASAQDLEKEVVVTREYTPTLATPDKLAVTPRLDDTVTLRPDFAYSITPVEWQTHFDVKPITAASTYVWNFSRQPLLYVKAGAGYPFNTTGDLAFSWYEANAGGVGLDVMHRGQWNKIDDAQGIARTASHTDNKLSLYGFTNVGKHYKAGIELDGRYRMYHYYGDVLSGVSSDNHRFSRDDIFGYDVTSPSNTVDGGAHVWFGSDFTDMSFTNFRITVGADYMTSSVKDYIYSFDRQAYDKVKVGLLKFDARAELGQMFGRHGFYLSVDYANRSGKNDCEYSSSVLTASPRYLFDNGAFHLQAGVTVALSDSKAAYSEGYFGRIDAALADGTIGQSEIYRAIYDHPYYESENKFYIFPYLRLSYNDGTTLTPFVEADGGVVTYDPATMLEINPYTMIGYNARNGRYYSGRLGLSGATRSSLFSYSVWAGFRAIDRMLYPYLFDVYYMPEVDENVRVVFGGEMTLRPAKGVEANLVAHYYMNTMGPQMSALGDNKGLPVYDVKFDLKWNMSRRWQLGVRADVVGKYRVGQRGGIFASQDVPAADAPFVAFDSTVDVPTYVNLGVSLQYDLADRFAIWAEANNLLNRRNMLYPLYPTVGINFTAGIKIVL